MFPALQNASFSWNVQLQLHIHSLKHFHVHLQRPDLFTTEQMGTNTWLSVGDVSKLRTMYGCDAPGQGRKKFLLPFLKI